MPSATVGNGAAQSASPELGLGSHSEVMKQVINVIEKKVRNMEKKKGKLDDYQAKKNNGERLNQDQLDALTKFGEITNNLEFARELQKGFLTLGQEVSKVVKKSVRREQLQREEMEQRRLKMVLELQFLLDRLGEEEVRQDLKRPDGDGTSVLTDADLRTLDQFYKLVGPDRNYDVRLTDQYEDASLHLWELLEGRDKPVAGTTYKVLKETLDKVLLSGYFDRVHTHQNGAVCEEVEEGEEESQIVEEEEQKAEEPPSEPEGTATEDDTEPLEVETTEFVNRQFIPETAYSATEQDQVDGWAVEAQMVNSLQHQPLAQLTPEPPASVDQDITCPPADPVVRKQVVQDLMAQMQGTFNFMQDSMLEFDGQALDPAIVSAQPMKPAQTVGLQQMGLVSAHTESRLPQTTMVSGPLESSQASLSRSSEQCPAPSSLPSAFPPVSKPTHSGGTNVNAAPFQSMQAVFNMNAPVPTASDGSVEPLKQPTQFPSGYAQGFSSPAEHTGEQADVPQDALQSVVGGFQPHEQAMAQAGAQQQSAQPAGFTRPAQPYFNGRGAPRGGPRGGRGIINGYRGGASNGFRGEGYRPPFSNAPNSGYGQNQFNTTRDYPNSTYQREGYQPGYKRGAAQGARGCPRGNGQAMRS
ncbi:caprin-1a isoform X1 [Gadus morhua]|uniref:Cell cycle associated protein 1a n=1 Tax=Gadus morhua TaxID=8049 RepID=A0A8C4Z9B7_GADMO|nr:caprin-1-like isoform X1 [Gadus morhua]XP_030234029.1 caprin-1-like isoform X1 [Gadus morhua]